MAEDKQKKEIALSVLEQNTQANAVWITFDNQAFLLEVLAKNHHEKHGNKKVPDVFFREGTQDENLSDEDYKKIIENQDNLLKEFQTEITKGKLEVDKFSKELESCKSEIESKDSKIKDISALNLQYEEKVRELSQENESLKARILELETAKPETVKDEGNAPKKGK